MQTKTVYGLAVLALGAFLVVSAYEYLTVDVPFSLAVVSPGGANIALVAGADLSNADTWQGPGALSPTYVGSYGNGYLELKLGPWGKNYKVFFSRAFAVTNYDDEAWKIWFDVGTPPTGVVIKFEHWTGSAWEEILAGTPLTLDSGATASIGVEFAIGTSATLSPYSWTAYIQGQESSATGTPSAPGSPG